MYNHYYADSNNNYFTKYEALEKIKEVIECGYDGYWCDLHNEVFNTDYYIIGRYDAEETLEEYGTFKAVGVVASYEKDAFGEINTDISDPEKIANMLWYIIGEEVIGEIEGIYDCWNDRADEDSRAKVLEEIDNMMKEEN